MSKYSPVEGDFRRELNADVVRLALVSTRWNQDIIDGLLDGAFAALARHGIAQDDVAHFQAPGAYELPLVCQKLAASGEYDAVIALGAVIRGGTPHFEYVSEAATHGLLRAGQDTGVPVIFGVLTLDTMEQAIERSSANDENKGAEAALTALEMISLMKKL